MFLKNKLDHLFHHIVSMRLIYFIVKILIVTASGYLNKHKAQGFPDIEGATSLT
jgi:hypothetical protein